MNADTFPKYYSTLAVSIYQEGYPSQPKTLGEHVRKRRMELGLYQGEVAKRIGVAESSVWNWEHGIEPEIRFIPDIIKFLGYVPFDSPTETIALLSHYKLINGLSYERLGKQMGRDPEQLTDWLSGRKKPCRRNIDKIDEFLKKHLKQTCSQQV